MNRLESEFSGARSPLERFLREYVAARDGVWDMVEPAVYDVLLDAELARVTFDPEALPEHAGAQLASFGSPLFDRLLADAAGRWNSAVCYRTGVHVGTARLGTKVERAIQLPKGFELRVERARAMHFPQAVFWFTATFTSDQKENEILPIGVDLHQLREVRHLDSLLAFERLSEEPEEALAEAPHEGLVAGYRVGRAQAGRSLAAMANARRRDWSGAVEKQINRMRGYYAQLQSEAAEAPSRTADAAVAAARVRERQESIQREQTLRISELQRKSELRVEVKLSSLLVVHQPKLLMSAAIVGPAGISEPLQLVWDPLIDAIEAARCPVCGRPTFAFVADRRGVKCGRCAGRR